MESEVDRIKESLTLQNEEFVEAITNGTTETNETLKTMITNMTKIMDKMAF